MRLRKPSVETVRRELAELTETPYSYEGVGTTATTPPAGYRVDRTRARLGTGRSTFLRAREALRAWRQFSLKWLEVIPRDFEPAPGCVVALVCHAYGFWWVNPTRVVYVVDETETTVASDGSERFGFAYGTLPSHVEAGEERFLIEYQPDDGSVWYEILAFSRARHPLVRLAAPLGRRLQRRFTRQSVAALARAVSSGVTADPS